MFLLLANLCWITSWFCIINLSRHLYFISTLILTQVRLQYSTYLTLIYIHSSNHVCLLAFVKISLDFLFYMELWRKWFMKVHSINCLIHNLFIKTFLNHMIFKLSFINLIYWIPLITCFIYKFLLNWSQLSGYIIKPIIDMSGNNILVISGSSTLFFWIRISTNCVYLPLIQYFLILINTLSTIIYISENCI